MDVSVSVKGKDKATAFLLQLTRKKRKIREILEKYGQFGCQRLAYATPFDTGETALSWSFEIIEKNGLYGLQFNNSHIEKGVNIAVILQTGHPTRTGGWVEGRDYINEALQPIFDDIAEKAWMEVKSV